MILKRNTRVDTGQGLGTIIQSDQRISIVKLDVPYQGASTLPFMNNYLGALNGKAHLLREKN